jgi:tRNA-dihydrouridine synthase
MSLEPTLYLAPLHGVTDRIFRNAYVNNFEGFDLAVAPFIATTQIDKEKKVVFSELQPQDNRRIRTIPQILSKDPPRFCELAQGLFELGYDSINWNLGCPYPMVARKGRGAGMLPHPQLIDQLLDYCLPRLKPKLSIKLRLGLIAPDEIDRVLPVLNRYPLQEIIIHPRTARQMYTGTVDLDAFERCLSLSTHPVVYNGDITSAAVYRHLARRFASVNGWMIGRGALSNPFLPAEIKGLAVPTQEQKLARLFKYHQQMYEEYLKVYRSPRHFVDKMKSFWGYLADGFENSHKIRKRIRKVQNMPHYLDEVDRLFGGELVFAASPAS